MEITEWKVSTGEKPVCKLYLFIMVRKLPMDSPVKTVLSDDGLGEVPFYGGASSCTGSLSYGVASIAIPDCGSKPICGLNTKY
jgi:hypothetical protein